MRTQILATVILTVLFHPVLAKPADMYPGHTLSHRFEGHYPCIEGVHPRKCDRIKVWLFLFTDERTGENSRYNFGYIVVGVDNERTQFEGSDWKVSQTGTEAHPSVPIIELGDAVPIEYRRHWLIDDHLLLLLSPDGTVKPGHPDGGFTLYNYTMQKVLPRHWP